MTNQIAKNLSKLKQSINSLRAPQDVKILAVAKGQSISLIEQAIECGMTDFAENYVIEAEQKWKKLKLKYPHIKLHFIGHLQSNKVERALKIFDVIHTIDSLSIIKKLIKYPEYSLKEYFIQIKLNPSGAYGITKDDLPFIIEECRKHKINVVGLMGIAPLNISPDPSFETLENLAKANNLPQISAGMSADFMSAIEHGSTYVRIGTALFGERKIIHEYTPNTKISLYLLLKDNLVFDKISQFIQSRFDNIEVLDLTAYETTQPPSQSILITEHSLLDKLPKNYVNAIILFNKHDTIDKHNRNHLLYLPLRLEELASFIYQKLLNIINNITLKHIQLQHGHNLWLVTNTKNNKTGELTEKEGLLLKVLLTVYPYHIDRANLLKEVWQITSEKVETHTLESHISSLRKKLSTIAIENCFEITKHENGYLVYLTDEEI